MALSTQDTVDTSCIRPIKKITGSHIFKIMGYSFDKNNDKENVLESTIFSVGGYNWSIQYCPNGSKKAGDDDYSIFLCLKSEVNDVKAKCILTILDGSGTVLKSHKLPRNFFKTFGDTCGYHSFAKRAELESKIKDDFFVIKCVVTVFKVLPPEPTLPIVLPAGNIELQLGHLLEHGTGTDVTFEVNGITFCAHKCILAARSPVFLAQFFGLMKEKSDTNIKIEEMKAPVFKSLLHFIYHDSFLGFEEQKENEEEQDTQLMTQHLLAAADRYGLERLKIMCEKMLADTIDISKVVSLLSLADMHNCIYLKSTCLKLLATCDTIGDVLEIEEFQQLIKNEPLILKELLRIQKHS